MYLLRFFAYFEANLSLSCCFRNVFIPTYVSICFLILVQSISEIMSLTVSIAPESIWYCKISVVIPRDLATLTSDMKLSFFSLVFSTIYPLFAFFLNLMLYINILQNLRLECIRTFLKHLN